MYYQAYTEEYKGEIESWLKARGLVFDSMLPKVGYMTCERGQPIACAFIRHVEGTMCMLDGLATNPDAPSDMRDTAIDMVVEKILKEAKALGYKGIMATSSDEHTLIRGKKFGFQPIPHALVVATFPK